MRTLAGLMTMILLALLLAACGSDDDNGEATEKATTLADIATEEVTEVAIETETTEATEAAGPLTGVSSPAAAPGGMASPAAAVPPLVVIASPAASALEPAIVVIATPQASPVAATPASGAAVAPVAVSDDDPAATPAAGDAIALSGKVVLPGTVNEAWVITDDGCVGLGAHADLMAGRQLVVRDAEGAIVGVTVLEASDETDACAWTFSLDVPESEFYAVSIPMVVEHVFTRQEVEQSDGVIVVPVA